METIVYGMLTAKNFFKEQNRRVYDPQGIAPALQTMGGGVSNSLTTVTKDSMVVIRGQALTKNEKDFLVMEEPNIRIRKLTPRECMRLMSFDDKDYEAIRDAGVSNSQTYKQAGNSICVNVLEAIFGQLFEGKEDNYRRWDTVNLPNIRPVTSVNEEASADPSATI